MFGLTTILVCSLVFYNQICAQIDFLSYFETFTATVTEDADSVRRVRRSLLHADERHQSAFTYKFSKFGHQFNVLLNSRRLFAKNPLLIVRSGKFGREEQPLNISTYYQGHLEGKDFLHEQVQFIKICNNCITNAFVLMKLLGKLTLHVNAYGLFMKLIRPTEYRGLVYAAQERKTLPVGEFLFDHSILQSV